MTPTNKLRFVEREIFVPFQDYKDVVQPKKVRILQQWWEDRNITLSIHIEDKDGNPLPSPNRGEWRDVPVEVKHD
jgi:hypothetical protein